jgi:DNA polymerase III sliding clamp (beta) subunit (PCNA family)
LHTKTDKNGKQTIEYEYSVKCVTDNGATIWAKVIDDPYPKIEQIIPTDNEQVVVLDTKKLKNTLSAIAKINNPEDTVVMEYIYTSVRLSCGKVKVDFSPYKMNTHKKEDELLRYGFRCKYLLEALGDGKDTVIEAGLPLNPIMVKCGKLKAVIMPVRLS